MVFQQQQQKISIFHRSHLGDENSDHNFFFFLLNRWSSLSIIGHNFQIWQMNEWKSKPISGKENSTFFFLLHTHTFIFGDTVRLKIKLCDIHYRSNRGSSTPGNRQAFSGREKKNTQLQEQPLLTKINDNFLPIEKKNFHSHSLLIYIHTHTHKSKVYCH